MSLKHIIESDEVIVTVCQHQDSIKFYNDDRSFGMYVPLGEEITKEYCKYAISLDYKISDGICPPHFKQAMKELNIGN